MCNIVYFSIWNCNLLFKNNCETLHCYYFKTADNHNLGGSHPAHGLSHCDTPQYANQRHHEAQHPLLDAPSLDHMLTVTEKHTNKTDNKSSNTKPENKDRIVDMLGLSANNSIQHHSLDERYPTL